MKYSFDDLVKIMATLRSENGCPWDREQDTRSLLPYLVEESCEFIDAAQAHDVVHQCEELGDVLFQIVFHSQVAREKGDYTIDDVVNGICEKMVRRHPHVFGDAKVDSSAAVTRRWEQIKANEANNIAMQDASAMDKVSKSMPVLARAQEVQRRAAKVGFDWKKDEDSYEKVLEEFNEFAEELKAYKSHEAAASPGAKSKEECLVKQHDLDRMEDEFGDLLFSLVNLARHSGLNAATALMRASSKFERRFRQMEVFAGGSIKGKTDEEMLDLWGKAKSAEA